MVGLCSGSNFPDCTRDYMIPDPDIAGIGVIISFGIGNGLIILLSLIALFFIKLEDLELGGFDRALNKTLRRLPLKPLGDKMDAKTIAIWFEILEKVILGISDTQLLTGIAILIAGYVKCSISVYPSNIVSDLAWFASGTHLSALQVLRAYMARYPAIRGFRQGNRNWYFSPPTPAQCLSVDTVGNIGGASAASMAFNMFLIVLYYSTSIYKLVPEFNKSFSASHLYLWTMRKTGRSCRKTIKTLGSFPKYMRKSSDLKKYLVPLAPFLVVAELAILVCAIVLIILWAVMYYFSLMIDSYAVGAAFDLAWFGFGIFNVIEDRKTGQSFMATQDRPVENQWGFGQLVPCLLLLLPFMTMFEIWYEARCKAKEEREKAAKERELIALLRHASRISIPVTPTNTPKLRLPVLSKEERRRLAEEDRALDDRLVAILPLPAPAHRRSLSVDSSISEDDRFELRSMNFKSQERLIPGSPVVDAQSRLSVGSQVSTPAATSIEGLEEPFFELCG